MLKFNVDGLLVKMDYIVDVLVKTLAFIYATLTNYPPVAPLVGPVIKNVPMLIFPVAPVYGTKVVPV